MKRIVGNPEDGTDYIAFIDNYYYFISLNYVPFEQEIKETLDQILSTIQFLE